MFTLNNRTFAKNAAEFAASLFTPGGTCVGFYKQTKNGVRLYNLQNVIVGLIVDNKYGERFIVSAGVCNGKNFYMNGASSTLEKWLGLDGLTVTAERELLNAAIEGTK